MKKQLPIPSETPEANLTQFAVGRAAFHPLEIPWHEALRRSLAHHFPAQVLEPCFAKHKSECGRIPAEESVRAISSLKCRRFTPILKVERSPATVDGRREIQAGAQ